jgi:pimeloyl-ACP methyl ester carboxylesterase
LPDFTITTPDGVELFVVALGPEGAPPIVALHGGPAAHHDYLLPAFATLADQRRVILYDQRGGGRSRVSGDKDLSAGAHVRDVGAVLDALGLARADLLGYSFGGLWAYRFTAEHPERVGKLVLASSVPAWHGYRNELDAALASAQRSPWVVAERDHLERSGMRERNPEEYRRRRFALSVAGYFKDPRLSYGLTPFKVQAAAADALRKDLGDFDFRALAPRIGGHRALVLHGEDDPIHPVYARDTAARIGCPYEGIPRCGHVPYVEAADRFFAILRAFLERPIE